MTLRNRLSRTPFVEEVEDLDAELNARFGACAESNVVHEEVVEGGKIWTCEQSQRLWKQRSDALILSLETCSQKDRQDRAKIRFGKGVESGQNPKLASLALTLNGTSAILHNTLQNWRQDSSLRCQDNEISQRIGGI